MAKDCLWYLTSSHDSQRFDLPEANSAASSSKTMLAMVTMGAGGHEQLQYRRVPRPHLRPGEVLLQVLAAGINNTDINTRLGWYSSNVTSGTEELEVNDNNGSEDKDGGWSAPTPFPFIQGADCCGKVTEIYDKRPQNANSNNNVDDDGAMQLKIGDRVLVSACMPVGDGSGIWLGVDFDGAFAQFLRVPASQVYRINDASMTTAWTPADLASLPCAYGTAENMVHKCQVTGADRVLISGASGGVGSALVQLCKRRGAYVIALTGSSSKTTELSKLGADRVVVVERNGGRGGTLTEILGENAVDVALDCVAGDAFAEMGKLLKRGGRYACSGAIAGPMVTFDIRDVYLKDLTLMGCTRWEESVFRNLVDYVERGEIRPVVAKTFELKDMAAAQEEFLQKKHVGKLVLIPPELETRSIS